MSAREWWSGRGCCIFAGENEKLNDTIYGVWACIRCGDVRWFVIWAHTWVQYIKLEEKILIRGQSFLIDKGIVWTRTLAKFNKQKQYIINK